ncbi:hypothetical protein BJ742DRAFT_825452 [Cladochytrium replicatum]|nr:hypothetical protein BJ742DRAFT_825452 [Cladochytrium replicatum]
MMNSIFLFNLVLSTALVTLAQPRFDRPPSLPMDFPPNLLQQCQTLYRSLMQMNAIPAWNLTDANCCSTYKNDDGGANPWPWGTTIGADKPSIGCSLYNGSPSIDSIVVTTSPGCTGKFLDTRGLPQLKWLAITDCDLSTQSIPWDTFASYNPQLKIIFLSGLKLVGPLTPSVALLKNLEVLDLTNNFLSGSFPAELGNMISLKRLHLTGNLLSGYLPASLAQLVNLASLKLDSNHFMSPIPSLAAMSQLFACNLFIPSCRSTYEEWPVACLGNGSAPICGFAEPDPNAPIENAPAGLNIGFIVMAALGASLLAALIVGVFSIICFVNR